MCIEDLMAWMVIMTAIMIGMIAGGTILYLIKLAIANSKWQVNKQIKNSRRVMKGVMKTGRELSLELIKDLQDKLDLE